jgi:hypothetical protein
MSIIGTLVVCLLTVESNDAIPTALSIFPVLRSIG